MKKKALAETTSTGDQSDEQKALESNEVTPENEQAPDSAVEGSEPVNVTELLAKLDKLTRQSDRIVKAEGRVERLQNKVAQSTQAQKVATAQLKSDIGARDKAVVEMQRVIKDVRAGQQCLPGTDEDDAGDEQITTQAAEVPGSSENWPISELGAKRIKLIVGSEAFESAKTADDPIGLSDKQIEKLEAADFTTIADLEKQMREDSWWHKKVAADSGAAIIQRVISTLLAFRKIHPLETQLEAPVTETVLEKLAVANSEPVAKADDASQVTPESQPATAETVA